MDKIGNDNEFEEFYLQEYKNIFRYLNWRIRDPNHAHDLLHDSMIAIYQQHCKYKKPYSHALLLKIARNKANYFLRQRESRSNYDQKIIQESEQDSLNPISLEDELFDRERFQIAMDALQLLNEREKKCLELQTKGLSYEEVAKELRLKAKTVGAIISRAKDKLKGFYKKNSHI